MKNNILIIENSLLPSRGGIEKVSDTLSKLFEEKGYQCFFAYRFVDNPNYPEHKKIFLSTHDKTKNIYKKLKKFIEENNIKYIINQNMTGEKFFFIFKNIKKDNKDIRIITCLHNTPNYINYISKPNSFKIRLIIKFKQILYRKKNIYIAEQQKLYNLSDKYVVLSETFIPEAVRIFQLKSQSKLISITNPIALTQPNITQKKKRVLIVARFDEAQKNILSALRIWEIVSKQVHDWQLKIIGYGDMFYEYQNFIKSNNIKNIILTGEREDPMKYYSQSSIFMMTSRYEGLCLTLIEALQNQCVPIAFSTFSSLQDIIINQVNGIIIPPYEEKKYANEMIKLMSNPNLLAEYQKQSYITLEKFSPELIINQWINLFKSIY